MELIDWRELYAANRAVIEGREPLGPRGGGARLALPRQTTGELIRLEHDDGRRGRPVFVYAPPDPDPATRAPLVVMLHGCTQTAASFSAGSLMNRAADRHGFVVAYPEQSREENPSCCWNWFSSSHQARGGGEPASIAGATRTVAEAVDRWTIDPARVFVAGMSAGGAMAAVMAATYPDLFAAVAIHSGLAYGSARSLPSATQAMRAGGPDPEAQGDLAFAAMGDAARVVPAIVVHRTADPILAPAHREHAVRPRMATQPRSAPALVAHGAADAIAARANGERGVRQWMAPNRRASRGAYTPDLARPDATVRDDGGGGGRPSTRRTWLDRDGSVVQEQIVVEG